MPKLNILKHKSWHPGNQEAIDRVRKDEREAKEVHLANDRKRDRIDGEARLAVLRQRAQQRYQKPQQSAAANAEPKQEHINLFGAEEAVGHSNEAYEKEKSDREKQWRRRNNAEWLLDDGSNKKPWYLKESGTHPYHKRANDGVKAKREERRKQAEDPLSLIEATLGPSSPAKLMDPPVVNNPSTYQPSDTQSQLRQERLQREMEERRRAEELLMKRKI
jgi:hypothetical protein